MGALSSYSKSSEKIKHHHHHGKRRGALSIEDYESYKSIKTLQTRLKNKNKNKSKLSNSRESMIKSKDSETTADVGCELRTETTKRGSKASDRTDPGLTKELVLREVVVRKSSKSIKNRSKEQRAKSDEGD